MMAIQGEVDAAVTDVAKKAADKDLRAAKAQLYSNKYYRTHKDKYRIWQKRYRDRKKAEKLAAKNTTEPDKVQNASEDRV